VAEVLERRIKCSKLIPSLGGLLQHLNTDGVRNIKFFLDAFITERGDRVRTALCCAF
jgi:hypothetical protein